MKDTITPERLRTILAQPGHKAEAILFDRILFLDETARLSHAETGIICSAVQAHMLWREHKGCTSFADWMRLAAPWGRSKCYQAMRDIEELADMPLEAVAQIPTSNFPLVMQLSTAVRNDPAVIEAAQTQDSDGLAQHIQRHHPEQHVERKKVKRFTLDESALIEVEAALNEAMARGAQNESQAIEWVCAEARLSWQAEDEFKRLAVKTSEKAEGYLQ